MSPGPADQKGAPPVNVSSGNVLPDRDGCPIIAGLLLLLLPPENMLSTAVRAGK